MRGDRPGSEAAPRRWKAPGGDRLSLWTGIAAHAQLARSDPQRAPRGGGGTACLSKGPVSEETARPACSGTRCVVSLAAQGTSGRRAAGDHYDPWSGPRVASRPLLSAASARGPATAAGKGTRATQALWAAPQWRELVFSARGEQLTAPPRRAAVVSRAPRCWRLARA